MTAAHVSPHGSVDTPWAPYVATALKSLSSEQRVVLDLLYRAAMPPQAIAAATSMSVSTVKTTIARALQDLAAALGR